MEMGTFKMTLTSRANIVDRVLVVEHLGEDWWGDAAEPACREGRTRAMSAGLKPFRMIVESRRINYIATRIN